MVRVHEDITVQGQILFVKKRLCEQFSSDWADFYMKVAFVSLLTYPMQWLEVLFNMLRHYVQLIYEYTGRLQILRPNGIWEAEDEPEF